MIEELLPPLVASWDTRFEILDEPLFPGEVVVVSRAVARRQREFQTVRGCARMALRQIGLDRGPIVPDMRGVPSWPAGIIGSMTHCDGYRAAAVARATDLAAVGIDAEPNAPTPHGVIDLICAEGDRVHLAELRAADVGTNWDRVLFSAKESVFKAWFPQTRIELGFEDVAVRFRTNGTFTADFRRSVDGVTTPDVAGRWLRRDGVILTTVTIGKWPRTGRGDPADNHGIYPRTAAGSSS